MDKDTVTVRGIEIHPFTDADKLIDYAFERKGILIAVNAEKIVKADDELRHIINSNIGYCDGVGAVSAVRRKGAQARKIAGCELWLHIVRRHHADKSFYIIGATPEVNAATVAKLRQEFPDINIAGARDGYLRDEEETEALIEDIVRTKPDVVFVAMGSPTQEKLMMRMFSRHKAVYQGLGGSFDVYSGKVPRAPKWWLDHNLEFAYRLIRQPSRWRRNLNYFTFAWWWLTGQL